MEGVPGPWPARGYTSPAGPARCALVRRFAAPALVWIEPGGVKLLRIIGGDPQGRGRKGGAALREIVGREQRGRRMAGAQLVGGILAEPVLEVRVDDAPHLGAAMLDGRDWALLADRLLGDGP